MADELKHELSPACLEPARPSASPPEPASRTSDREPSKETGAHSPQVEARWFEAIDPEALVEPPRGNFAAALLALIALAFAAFGRALFFRALVPAALAIATVVLLLWNARRAANGRAAKRGRGIGLDPARLSFQGAETGLPQTLLSTSEPFGVTLLSTPRRDRLVALLTSASGTFCVGSAFDPSARRAYSPLCEHAFTVASDEMGLEAIGPDGSPIVLAPADFAALVSSLTSLDRSSWSRLVLSDARGAPIVLDGRSLRIGERALDLDVPLEWRGIVFQEAFGQAVAVYQGTWIRQGSVEVVLVSLLPSLMSASPASVTDGSPLTTLDRSVLRDLRLMQAVPDEPPPSEQRVAVERLFMLPLRSALDKAPRPLKQPNRARA